MKDHLYVMQSADGFIKIGRSKHPRVRRRALCNERRCAVILIGYFKGRGSEERRILVALAEHRATGEWFHDTPSTRAMLLLLLGKIEFRENFPHISFKPKPPSPDDVLASWLTKQDAERERLERVKIAQAITKAFTYARWSAASLTPSRLGISDKA